MLHKVGREIIYRNGAFKTPSRPGGNRLWNPLSEQLRNALDLAAKLTLENSSGNWIVVVTRDMKMEHGVRADDIMAQLTVYVPAETDQRQETLNVLESFEDIIAERLGAPVDPTFRSIEEDHPRCAVCNLTATQIRDEVRDDGISNPSYFCDRHTSRLSDRDFIGHTPVYSWMRL